MLNAFQMARLVERGDEPRSSFQRGNVDMTWYYVDLENIAYDVLPFIETSKPKHARFFMYWSDKLMLNKFEFFIKLVEAAKRGHHFEFIKCPSGDQGMDKMIIMNLTMHVSKSNKRNYVIISKDNGYDPFIKQLRAKTKATIKRKQKPDITPESAEG